MSKDSKNSRGRKENDVSENVEDLKKQIRDLESELAAMMRREEVDAEARRGVKSKVKAVVKGTKIWEVFNNPESKVGKVMRLPRTAFRIAKKPTLMKEIRDKRSGMTTEEKGPLFAPIQFFYGADDSRRVNVIMKEMDDELVKIGVEMANAKKAGLRIVTMAEEANPMRYREIVKKRKLPRVENVSFYSATDQAKRETKFELEVSNNDIFVTKAWGEYE